MKHFYVCRSVQRWWRWWRCTLEQLLADLSTYWPLSLVLQLLLPTLYFILLPTLYFILATLYFIRHIPSKIVTQQKSHFQKPFRLLWFEIGRYGRSDRMRFEVIIYKKIIFVVWGISNKRYFCYILICVFLCCVQLVIKKIYFCGKKKTV